MLFLILVGRYIPFGETLDWLKFLYTVDSMRDYVVPVFMVLVPYVVSEEDPLFPWFW